MFVKQISIFIENKSGRLADVTQMLADNGINIHALSIADTTDFGILRLIVAEPEKAFKLLKDHSLTVKITDVLAIGVPDTPGGLAKVLRVLSDNDISVEYMYAFNGRLSENALVILKVDNNVKAIDKLNKNDIFIVSSDQVYSM